MRALLMLACLWPFCHKPHVERFQVTISTNGHTEYKFKKAFKATPACSSPAGGGLEYYPERIVIHGKPGEVASVTCQ